MQLNTCEGTNGSLNLEDVFGVRCLDGRVEATWYTGELFAPFGKPLLIDINNYLRIYAYEWNVSVKSGKVTRIQKLDNTATHISIYHDSSQKLLHFIYQIINWDKITDLESTNQVVYIKVETGNKPRPNNVQVEKECNNAFLNQEAVRVILSIPDWDIYYVHGKPKVISYILPVRFSKQMKEKYGRANLVEK